MCIKKLVKWKDKPYLSPENTDMNVWLWFRRTFTAISKARQKELRPYGISLPESAVLYVVHELNNRVTPTEISRQLLTDIHSISQLLVRMENRGLLRRVKDFPRKNMIRVALTRKGREIRKQAIAGETMTNIMSDLSESEKKQFLSYLSKMRSKAMNILH